MSRIFLWVLILIPVSSALAEEPAPRAGSSRPVAAPKAGPTVAGRVVYRPDPARPWETGRKYIQDAERGELAQCVVALRAASLKDVAPPKARQTHVVDQQSFQFTPQIALLRAGDSVQFLNSDATTHNVRAESRLATFNENASPGFDYTHRFDRAGGVAEPITVGCVFHPDMRVWIYVFDQPFFALTKEDGSFQFKGVPAGKYRLDVAHPFGRLRRSLTVDVAEEGWSGAVELNPDHRLP